MYVDIESKLMKKQSFEVDKAESVVTYTRKKFITEFKRMMETDESKTLKYQMINVSKLVNYNLIKMRNQMLHLDDKTLRDLNKKYFQSRY